MLKGKQGEQALAHGASVGCERAWHFSFPGKSPLRVLFREKSSAFWKARKQHANTKKPWPFHTWLHETRRGRAPVSYSPPPSYNLICLFVCLFI